MSNVISTHNSLTSDLMTKYQQNGYEVIFEPDPTDLPFDLGHYQPDLIARKGDGGYIIEVKASGTRVPIDRYSEISKQVARYPGWRFLLVTSEEDSLSEQPHIGGGLLTWEQITQRVEQADKILSSGNSEAAFLFLWAAFEALLRKQAVQVSLPVERFPSSALIKHLYSQGELSMEQFDQAMELLEFRNRVVHGFQTVDLSEPAQQLNTLINDLLHSWCYEDVTL